MNPILVVGLSAWFGFGQVGTAEPLSIDYGGEKYIHRWTQAGQHEFTPNGQEDLARWRDMVTINVHPGVRSGEQLASLANQVLERYTAAGKVITTSSVPRTESSPAQHLVVAVLQGPNVLEAAFARFLLVNDQGIVIVYSHREYGPDGATALGTWLESQGSSSANTLMTWDGMPSLDVLTKLPTSK